MYPTTRPLATLLFTLLALPAQAHEHAPAEHAPAQQAQPSSPLQVQGALPALAAGEHELKFSEMIRMPVGPRGLEPSPKLLALDGKQVRLVGYMARQDEPTAGMFILSPLPVLMGHADDSFADDMPANSVFVQLSDANLHHRYLPGLIRLSGILRVGSFHEADGRVSMVRLELDAAQSAQLAESQPIAAAK